RTPRDAARNPVSLIADRPKAISESQSWVKSSTLMIADEPREVTMTAHKSHFPKIWSIVLGVLFLVFHPDRAVGDEVRWTQSIDVGTKYHEEGKYSQAEKAYLSALREAERFPEQDPRLSLSLNNLGFLYYDQGRYDEAEPLYLRALNLRERFLGAQHPDLASTLNNLGELYRAQARH